MRGRLSCEVDQLQIVVAAQAEQVTSRTCSRLLGSSSLPSHLRHNFGVIRRTLLHYETFADLRRPRSKYKSRKWSALSSDTEQVILRVAADKPWLYLDEMAEEVRILSGIHTSTSTIERLLLSERITVKCAEFFNDGRLLTQRFQCRTVLDAEYVDCLVFLDETHVSRKDGLRKRARAARGFAPLLSNGYIPQLAAIGATLLCACNVFGVLHEASYFFTETNTRDNFEMWIEQYLCPILRPYPQPNSVVVMDNASIHHNGRADELIRGTGAVLVYLPAYSYDFNPIEKVSGKLKFF